MSCRHAIREYVGETLAAAYKEKGGDSGVAGDPQLQALLRELGDPDLAHLP